jgi:hypothetical protein
VIYAQSSIDHVTVHFNSPVIVGETKLPAGECDIQVIHGSSDSVLVVLRSQDGPNIVSVASRVPEEGPDRRGSSSVVLNKIGNDLHLYRIMLADGTGLQLSQLE